MQRFFKAARDAFWNVNSQETKRNRFNVALVGEGDPAYSGFVKELKSMSGTEDHVSVFGVDLENDEYAIYDMKDFEKYKHLLPEYLFGAKHAFIAFNDKHDYLKTNCPEVLYIKYDASKTAIEWLKIIGQAKGLIEKTRTTVQLLIQAKNDPDSSFDEITFPPELLRTNIIEPLINSCFKNFDNPFLIFTSWVNNDPSLQVKNKKENLISCSQGASHNKLR